MPLLSYEALGDVVQITLDDHGRISNDNAGIESCCVVEDALSTFNVKCR